MRSSATVAAPKRPSPGDHGRSEVREDPALTRALERAERSLGARLRGLRQKAGLSQEAAAERSNLSPKHLRRLELGQANATLASLVACARAYRVTLADLFIERRKSP